MTSNVGDFYHTTTTSIIKKRSPTYDIFWHELKSIYLHTTSQLFTSAAYLCISSSLRSLFIYCIHAHSGKNNMVPLFPTRSPPWVSVRPLCLSIYILHRYLCSSSTCSIAKADNSEGGIEICWTHWVKLLLYVGTPG